MGRNKEFGYAGRSRQPGHPSTLPDHLGQHNEFPSTILLHNGHSPGIWGGPCRAAETCPAAPEPRSKAPSRSHSRVALSYDRAMPHLTTTGRLLLLSGLACLIIVVLTHLAEAFHIFPAMGWGLPNSAGHYLDLVSAILGCTLTPLGFLIRIIRRKNSS